MIQVWFQRLRSATGSVTAEAALSISMLVVTGFCVVQVFGFATQFQRLQTIAQESSRTAASLADPVDLEKQISEFVHAVDKNILVKIIWEEKVVSVKLIQPTFGLVRHFKDSIEVSASAPRWSG